MALVIGCKNPDNYGENIFVTKVSEYLDDHHIIYWNRQLFGREFDVCILIPDKGILVVELKGWREENILRIENNESVIIRTDDGEVSSNPQKQARGYRFSIERFIRQNLNKRPPIFQMVCLPQVTKMFFKKNRLDVVMEERFTILKEDLHDNTSFFSKLDQALREVSHWHSDPFDQRTMLEVRSLFETDIDLTSDTTSVDSLTGCHSHHYSHFFYVSSQDDLSDSQICELTEQYFQGCKLYAVLSSNQQLCKIVRALDDGLANHHLIRNRDNISVCFEEQPHHKPALAENAKSFMGFNCSFCVAAPSSFQIPTFHVYNGVTTSEENQWLSQLAGISQFNKDQYDVEHAAPEKNIVITAGAGTGKTYTMISRIGYICYSQNVPLSKIAERIVMITFTDDAANQMSEKLKGYFKNYYLITSNPEYLHMISLVDHMQISTIHSFAKKFISKLGTSFGYGVDLSITSSEFNRKKKISDILESYIQEKERAYGKQYTLSLGMPVYAIRDLILEFINKLHNKSIDISALNAANFGAISADSTHENLHDLLAHVIPEVELSYFLELQADNKIHLSTMMSVLNKFVMTPDSNPRIQELQRDSGAMQFMFIDEFQDTDDSQIESLLKISHLLNYRLFVVGDIKQCIYRFRGAVEMAFDELNIKDTPDQWLTFPLRRNYRTDSHLLDLFDSSFSAWGASENRLLTYTASQDRLLGTRDYNGYLLSDKSRFYKKIVVTDESKRIPAMVEEIRRLQRRIEYEESHGFSLSAKEKSIAILVRENWQADLVRTECARLGVTVHTNTGGDLYMSEPALDMLTLVNALVHFDEAEYLYNLVSSNLFGLDIPKSKLYEIREKIRTGGWRSKVDEREQVNYLLGYMNPLLSNIEGDEKTWATIVSSLRTQPVLQVIRRIYKVLSPWQKYSPDDLWKQHYYQLNVDLLFEQIINSCNVDRLTINTLQEHLYTSITAQISVDSRTPPTEEEEIPLQCITVHKSKGLEYGHVILPFCSYPIDRIKRSQLHISVSHHDANCHIGYSMRVGDTGQTIRNEYYNEEIEKTEKSREETRILYVAMTRAIRSFSWIVLNGESKLSWQNLIIPEA